MTDTLTILRHPVSPLAKTWNADGTITGYGDAKYFNRREVEISSLTELSDLLSALEDQETTVVIRGKYVGDRLARERDGTEFKQGKVRRALDYFEDQPLHTLLIDIDKFEPIAFDPIAQPVEAIDEYLQTMLPDAFAGAGYHWQLSNSHAHPDKGNTLNAHVWMRSREALTCAQLKAHAEEVNLAADTTLFNPVQAHYTAAPMAADGVVIPVMVRSGYVEGLLGDDLDLKISAAARAAASGVGGRAQRLRELADRDPVARALTAKGLVKSHSRDGAINITCPFVDEHGSGTGAETSTQYFLPNTNGHTLGQFKCLHDACSRAGRTRQQFLARLGVDEMLADGAEEFDDVREHGDDGSAEGGNATGAGTGGGSGSSGGGSGGSGAGGPIGKASTKVTPAQHLCTDLANANRIAKYFGKNLIVIADAWYTWTGKVWVKEDGDVWRDVALLSKLIKAEDAKWRVKPAADDAERARNIAIADALKKWGTQCEMSSKMSSAILLLKKMLTVSADTVDRARNLLNVRNGTIDLRTGLLQPHNHADLITKIIDIDYDPSVKAPVWMEVLAKITMEDGLGAGKPLAAFLKRWFGYCATGEVREHKFVVHYGQGSNGKSTLLDTMAVVMGGYAGTAAPGLLMASKSDKHPAEIADLFGKRMVTAHETGDGGLLREDFVKQATGGDRIKARFMRENFFEFDPTHKLQLLTNYKPGVRGQDNGIWRRILLVPYQARFGSIEEFHAGRAHYVKDTKIAEHIQAELPGVLAWVVEGAVEWYREGLQEPDLVRLASTDYQGEQDRVKQFVEECCQVEKGATTPLTGNFGILEAYQLWCREAGFSPMAKTRFVGELARVIVWLEVREERNQSGGVNRRKKVCHGVRLLEEA